MTSTRLRLSGVAILIILLFAGGISGYILIEGYTPLEAVYMTVITVGTVGFSEVRPLSDAGRVFTTVLILVGVGTFAFTFSAVVEYLLPENESKMRLAGANRVVSPYQIGGRHMANIIIRPHVTDFFDVVTLDGGIELWVEELIIPPGSILAGTTVGTADIRHRTGVTLVALLRAATRSTVMPTADTDLQAGDELIVLGTREQLAELQKLAAVQANEQTQ